MNLGIGLLAIAFAYFLEWHGYSEGKRKGYERGYCRGRTDANLWWLKMEHEVDQARQTIWKENT